jgi:pimeloyl-ACP methyl ester carboxylesterase
MTVAEPDGWFRTTRVDLAYTHRPGKSPPLLALHGFVWGRDALLPYLPQEQEQYAYDARGHGASGRTPGAYRFLDFGTDAADFLRGMIGRPSVLIGHSLGGMSAIYAAALCPDLVLGLYLADPSLYVTGKAFQEQGGSLFTFVQMFAGRSEDELARVPFLPAMWRSPLSRLDPDAVRMVLDGTMFSGFDTDALLKEVQCPVRLQGGERQKGASGENGSFARAVRQLKDVDVVNIAGAGHEAWLTAPDAFAKSIREFVERVT